MLEKIYKSKKYKKIYTYTLIGFTIVFIFAIPFFVKRDFFFGSFWFDLVIRVFLTTFPIQTIRYVSNLDESYLKFYKGAQELSFSEPDVIKQIINIISAIGSGIATFVFYFFSLSIFATYLGIPVIVIISAIIGLSVAIPMLLQFKKR